MRVGDTGRKNPPSHMSIIGLSETVKLDLCFDFDSDVHD